MRAVTVSVVVALTAWMALAIAVASNDRAGPVAATRAAVDRADREPSPSPAAPSAAGRQKVPRAAAIRAAAAFADAREGVVSFAVVNTEDRLRGRDENRRYAAASVVKAMLLAAEVRRRKQAHSGIDSITDSLLTAMITVSDNAAADSIYARVGDGGLFKVARRAGMKRFTVAGHWGNARITAADMARFFADLDRLLARKHREYAKGLLGSVVESQSWGIPRAAGDRWAVRFKGGWLPDHALVHQAAELRDRERDRSLSIAVLTDAQPSFEYGIETVRGVAERLLSASGGA